MPTCLHASFSDKLDPLELAATSADLILSSCLIMTMLKQSPRECLSIGTSASTSPEWRNFFNAYSPPEYGEIEISIGTRSKAYCRNPPKSSTADMQILCQYSNTTDYNNHRCDQGQRSERKLWPEIKGEPSHAACNPMLSLTCSAVGESGHQPTQHKSEADINQPERNRSK